MSAMRDLIVIGCGPAGASAALAAAREGLDVLVLEKKSTVGNPVRCGEYVPALILKDIPQVAGFAVQPVDGLDVSLPSGEILRASTPGFTIERDRFDRALAAAAQGAGAEIVTSACATEIAADAVRATVNGRGFTFHGRVIIGAEGPLSLVAQSMGVRRSRFALGFQERLPLTRRLHRASIYYDHRYVGGYAWMFPRGSEANVGLALDEVHSKDLRTLYLDFKRRLLESGIISSEKPLFKTCGLIPVSGMTGGIRAGHFLLTGDAAGVTHPLTGAGIAAAVISGRLAGELAAQSLKTGDISLLDSYEEGCALTFTHERALAIKEGIDSAWGTPRGDAILKDYWGAFGDLEITGRSIIGHQDPARGVPSWTN